MGYQIGGTYSIGDKISIDDVIYECIQSGVQTGRFTENSSKWDSLQGKADNRLENTITGVFEIPVVGTRYVADNQQRDQFDSVIFREYFGIKTNGQSITTGGVGEYIVDYLIIGDDTCYRGYTADGTNRASISLSVGDPTFTLTNFTCDQGWVEYTIIV